tara:strand:- start:1511 stop:1828 length:318 start_codon:yes stop_codon:yes gene_type:complete
MNQSKEKVTQKKTEKKQSDPNISKKEVEEFVVEQVFSKMGGKPDNFYKIRAYNVFDNSWRVDVWNSRDTGDNTLTRRISIDYSYFVKTDETGKILDSDPSIDNVN